MCVSTYYYINSDSYFLKLHVCGTTVSINKDKYNLSVGRVTQQEIGMSCRAENLIALTM